METTTFNLFVYRLKGMASDRIAALIKFSKKNGKEFSDEQKEIVREKLIELIEAAQYDIKLCLENNFNERDLASEKHVMNQSKSMYKAMCFIMQQLTIRF